MIGEGENRQRDGGNEVRTQGGGGGCAEREEACPHVLTLMGQYLIIWNSRAVFCSQGCSSLLEHLQGRQVIKL